MTYFSILQPLIAGGFVLFALYASFRRRPDLLMGAVLASMGFGNFWVFAASSIWSPIKLTSMIALGYVLVLSRNSLKGVDPVIARLYSLLCVWAAMGCVIGLVLPLPVEASEGGGFQSGVMRPIIQLLGYSATLSLFPLALVAARRPGGLISVLHIYNVAVVVVLAFAGLQILFYALGAAFIPIYRQNGFHNLAAAFSFDGRVIFRLYSTAGEPKALGIFLAPHAVMGAVLFFRPRNQAPFWWNRRILFAFSSIVCVLTYSTAALLALGLAWPIAFILSGRKDMLIAAGLIGGVIAGMLFLFDSVFGVFELESSIGNMVYARTFERLETDLEQRFEKMALDLLFANPANLITGFGLGMFGFHLGLVYSGGIEPIDSGWITLMMDMGLFGVCLVGFFILYSVRTALNFPGSGLKFGLLSCVLVSACLHLGTAALPSLLLWSGLALSAGLRDWSKSNA